MKKVEIIGDNYLGNWNKSRTTCRGIILEKEGILLSYETKNDQWMIPGGGREEGESDLACCIREIAEETGMLVEPSECMLEIIEYYEEYKLINKYFICKIVGQTERKQTQRELEAGMEPRWIAVDEIKEILAGYPSYAETNEMRRGLYQREYTALSELC